MPAKPISIIGHPQLALSAQDDPTVQERTLSILRKAGYSIEKGQLFPPQGADGRSIIIDVTAAFLNAKHS